MPNMFKLSVISSTLLISQFALAAPDNSIIVNQASADETKVVTQNNQTTIDIAPANNHGVSYNSYDAFNVDKKGLTFNNQTADAGMIINEVVSDQKSFLNGNMSVDGKKAHLVIANPNGISCNGCGITGAKQLTLTAGKIALSQDGALLGYYDNSGSIRINNTDGNSFSSVNKLNIIAENITIRNSQIKTADLTTFAGHELVKFTPGTVRGLEAIPGKDSAEKSKLSISKNSRINADNMYVSANNAVIKNHGQIEVGPVGDAKTQKYMNSHLTMDLVNSELTNGSNGNIHAAAANSILENSAITNNGTFKIDNTHKIMAIGNAVINNKSNMSSDMTDVTGLQNVVSGVGINNSGNLSGSLSVKANTIALNNKKYLEALDISTNSNVLAYINNGEIMNETAKFKAYELYHSGNGKITSRPVFEAEIKNPL
ncbi:filamentous hemagglutinin N-terminal domain-containing protein [Morganella psychrotolerans]|uniref:Filamentous hemagglutinin N-terminal domain-containing protein n=1 Tax=Morganella psychrotolerans TaxID=368603 RepID=A0A5M9R339_9GAMM|nr:filamentous hemagglutinin N-terminal domain-containing protein [Morganella psychrotolerans]KAA8714296.1 filamentous hemagglutinin N-terminal domain-containing protein [Morganella psychrotolerans]